MRLSERNVFVQLIESKDYGSVGVDGDSINLGLIQAVALAINLGALTGNSILTLYAGATAGAKTTAIAFRYRLSSADYGVTNADLLGDPTDVAAAGLTLTAASFDHRQLIIELAPIEMPAGKPYLTPSLDATATVLNVAAHAFAEPRYGAHQNPTIL